MRARQQSAFLTMVLDVTVAYQHAVDLDCPSLADTFGALCERETAA